MKYCFSKFGFEKSELSFLKLYQNAIALKGVMVFL